MKNLKGSTLIECIAAIAIFSISAFILLGGFLTAANLVVESVNISSTSDKVINSLYTGKDIDDVTYDDSGNVTFSFGIGSKSKSIKGKFISSKSADGYSLMAFIPENKKVSDIIPDTDFFGGEGIPTNGKWPELDAYESEWDWIEIPEGTTFTYNGKFYIAAQDLSVGPRGCTPFDPHLSYLFDSNNLIEITNAKPPIDWDGKSNLHSVINGLGYEVLNKGDMLHWNGNYYVFTIDNQAWPGDPLKSPGLWQMITSPY